MNRKSLSRQTAVDYPCTPESTKSRKPRKTADLIALNFSTLDESKSRKSIKTTTAKKTIRNNSVNAPPINAELPTRKILRARRMIKKDNSNEKSTMSQQDFEKLHDIIDKVTDKYFEFHTEFDDNESNKENETVNNNSDDNVTNIEQREIMKNKKSIEKPFKKRSFINSLTKNDEESVIIEKQSNGGVPMINNKKRHTIHAVNPQSQTRKSSKVRRTIHNLNETFSMDEDSSEEKPAKKRRTYELDVTVNKIEDLKVIEPKNNERSKLQRSSSFIFEDLPLEDELKPSTNDRRDTFDVLPKSTVTQHSFDELQNGSVIDLCDTISEECADNPSISTLIPQKSPINKRLNFSNITSRKKNNDTSNNSTLQEDSVIILDDTEMKEISKCIRFKIDNKSTPKSKVSIFKTPFKKTTESQDGFISSTPCVNGISQSKSSTSKNKPNTSSTSTTKLNSKNSRVKIPNFALLHQKAFSQMEDIVEYEKRKIERAQFLLSGKKPKSENSYMNNESTTDNSKSIKTKKLLRFAAGCVEKEQPADFIPLPSTPMPKFRKNVDDSPASMTPPTPKPKTATPKPRVANNLVNVVKATPKPKLATPKPKPVNNPFNFMANVNNPFGGKQATPKPTLAVRSNNINRFGFKIVDLPKPSRKDDIKAAVVNKTKSIKKGTEVRRDFIKGVRSNRRFDLLMKMRNVH